MQVLPAGRRDRVFAVLRAVEGAPSALNEPTVTWTEIFRVRAMREDVSDREQFVAGRDAATITARFVVPATPDTRTITTEDRASCDGRTWDIEGAKESRWSIRGRPAIEITATAPADIAAFVPPPTAPGVFAVGAWSIEAGA